MARVDVDAMLAAKREIEDESHVVVFRGREFTIPSAAPFTFLEACVYGRDETTRAFLAVRAILGDEYEKFLEARPTVDEATKFVSVVAELWGMEENLGESPASGGSSSRTTKPSRPTSNGSTRSTSAKRSGGRTPSDSDE
jgi:hypothetical protein